MYEKENFKLNIVEAILHVALSILLIKSLKDDVE